MVKKIYYPVLKNITAKIVFFLCLVFDGRPRSKEAVAAAAGAVAGEPTNDGI